MMMTSAAMMMMIIMFILTVMKAIMSYVILTRCKVVSVRCGAVVSTV